MVSQSRDSDAMNPNRMSRGFYSLVCLLRLGLSRSLSRLAGHAQCRRQPHEELRSDLSSRSGVVLLCLIQAFTLVATLGLCSFAYINRWTFFRRVYLAQQNGEDSYQAARAGADVIAFEFMWPIATCVLICGASLIGIIWMTLSQSSQNKHN